MDDAFNNAAEAYMRIGTKDERDTDKFTVDIYIHTKCLNHDLVRKAIEMEAEKRKDK